jgi:hypothetical protein
METTLNSNQRCLKIIDTFRCELENNFACRPANRVTRGSMRTWPI